MRYAEPFKSFLENHDMSINTIRSYLDTLEKFNDWLVKNYQIDNIAVIAFREIKTYKNELMEKYSPQTVNQKLSAIKTFFNFLVEDGIIEKSPADKVRLQKIEDYFEAQYLTRAEELSILDCAKKMGVREECLILLFLKTGIRLSEASNILIPDINDDNDNPTLLIRQTKNNKSRYIPLSNDVIEVIKRWLIERNTSEKIYHTRSQHLFVSQRSGKLSARGIQLILQKIGKKTNIKLYPIRFRATFANNLLQNTGIPINILATLLGHSNVNTTQRYATPNMMDKRKYIQQLSEL